MKSKILVTGGLGYIGSHTVVCLIEAGFEPVIADNLSRSDLSALDRLEKLCGRKITFHKTELCNRDEVESLFAQHSDIEGVIHFAAWLLVPESVEKPLEYYRNNLNSTINIAEASAARGLGPFVFSSSCTVYGEPTEIPVSENHPIQQAQSPYGNTKIIGEQMLRDYSTVSDLKVMSLRYFNPIGAHSSAMIGEVQHDVPTHLVPYITETAIGKREMLRVFGGDYDTRDGTCVRDYIHVMDIAEAHVSALKHLINHQKDGFDVINLGSGEGQTVLEMVMAFEKVTGIRIHHEIADRRPGDVAKVYADITKAAQILNWKPRRTLDEMLLSAWKWERGIGG